MGKEFYLISWGGGDFSYGFYSSDFLKKEFVGDMRLEEGIYAQVWKITVNGEE